MFSLLTPMSGLPWCLLPIWPLVFWRIQRLKAWFRAAGGPGSQMLWGVMWNGRVVVIRLSDDLSGHHPCTFRAPVSERLARVLTNTSRPCPRRTPGPQAIQSGIISRDPGVRRDYGFKIPDT
ncbi:hypothetical protein [Hyphomonas sp.]|uniref:hypothetical protein n=1 Tax=Hyphomonas sp. TaxID=87 RepID=UPI0030F5599D